MGAEKARVALDALNTVGRLYPDLANSRAMLRLTNDLPYIIAYDDGRKTISEVASEFGCSKQWVSQVLRRNGIRREIRYARSEQT